MTSALSLQIYKYFFNIYHIRNCIIMLCRLLAEPTARHEAIFIG